MEIRTMAVVLAGVVAVAGIAFAFLLDQTKVVVQESSSAVEPTMLEELVQVDASVENPGRFKGEIVP